MASSSKRKRDKAFNSSFFSSEQRHIKLRQDESPSMQTQANFIPSSGSHRRPPNTFTYIPNGDSNRQDIGNDSDDDLDQVIMAIDAKEGGTVGCCYYVAQEEKLHIFGDAQSGGTSIIETCDQFRVPYQLDIRPSQEFNYEQAKTKLGALEMPLQNDNPIQFLVPYDGVASSDQLDPENMGFTAQRGKILRLSGCIDMENRVSIGCAGALLTYIQRKRAREYLASDETVSAFRVLYVEMFSLQGTMFINPETLASLQILQSESHPIAFNQGPNRESSGAKENLSVYGLFNHHAHTPQGKAQLRQYFLRPSTSISVVTERHNFISVFLRPDNSSTLQKIVSSLKKIKNIRPVMINLRKGFNTGKSRGFRTTIWGTLLAFAFYSIDIQEALQEVVGGESLVLWSKALRVLDVASLHRVGRTIHETVDIDLSEEQHRAVVKAGVDRELDSMKDRFNGLDSLLKQVALDIASTIPAELGIDVNVIYFPQLGFNISIPFDSRGNAAYDGGDEAWEQMFTTENMVYFKDFRMREMDDNLGDIYGLVCEREIEIIYELAQRVLQYEAVLVEASDVCGELDCLLAVAQAANFYKFIRPRMTTDNVIKIKGGRHPLQELTVSSYVPNDTSLAGGPGWSSQLQTTNPRDALQLSTAEPPEGPSMLLLTGPNFSGKSVYLKQIQSTFMVDLQQISLALTLATNLSLLIIDEFGKGTDWSDGAGLACGIFEHLLSLGNDRPKVLAATHFHEIFENGYLKDRQELDFGHMEIRVDDLANRTGDQITYLYNFLPGRSNKSFGTVCAGMNGIDQVIVTRANEITKLLARGENLMASCATISTLEAEALGGAVRIPIFHEVIARKFLQQDFASMPAQIIKNALGHLLEE
ncbi:hypothetical protein Egran_02772 [Elaphomyces granulatus]|uniref:DNA mismatch repair proteins mutS family domain-containing protein n=1 Tax=Elaphomyces granulatus TaxID=519963 RepID=A0A232LZ66_9EURO|nr:hypothetical protein Egran_02772 [Elaphomyces granulatus]